MSARRQAHGGGGRSRPDRDAVGSSPRTGPLVDVVVGVALAGAVLMLYAPVTGYDFINFDDRDYVTENPHVRAGLSWAGFRWALTGIQASNWFPLTWLSHMLDWQLFGPNAGGHHATSVLLHAASSVFLFVGFRVMTGAVWPSAFVAALFALHPLRVESVAWIAERKDVLSVLSSRSACAATGATSRGPGSAPGSCWR